MLLGMQAGYTTYMCFVCLWKSRSEHDVMYSKDKWPLRQTHRVGEFNVQNARLVEPEDIILPPLHIKLGVLSNFVKQLTGAAFEHLKLKFSYLSISKLKGGVLNGPEIRALLADEHFPEKLTEVELAAFESFRDLCNGFFGNHKSPEYMDLLDNMTSSYHAMGVHMNLKIHFCNDHPDLFAENNGDVSDEHGERFHQEMKEMEKRYSGKSIINMLGDYVWNLVREAPEDTFSRKRKTKRKYFEMND